MKFEIDFIKFLQGGRSSFFDISFQLISELAGVLAVVLVFLFLLVFNRKIFVAFGVGYSVVMATVYILKNVIERARPYNVDPAIDAIGDVVTGFAMPSGHTATATAIAIFLGFFLFLHYRTALTRFFIASSCTMYVGLVALSRMYLGKHYLTDVIAGFAISAAICTITLILFTYYLKRRFRRLNENKNIDSDT